MERSRTGVGVAGEPMDVEIVGVGHAHIDVAWLWTLGQTVRKSGRTFSTALRLMEQFPDYIFSQSQPQLYAYTEQYYPEIFAQIKQRVKEGRWEPMGGTWVEPDCNAIGAELLARQFLLGRGYFQRHFGADCRYAGALAARYLRLQLGAAAVDQAGGDEVFHHPQDELEPVQPDA